MIFRFYEIFVDTPLSVCELRDVKGLYKKARDGVIKGFTGVTQEYEKPEKPDLIANTEGFTIRETTNLVIKLLEDEGIIPKTLRDVEQLPELFVSPTNKITALHEAKSLPKIPISFVELQWVQILSEGWAFPLKGFMREDEYLQVCITN